MEVKKTGKGLKVLIGLLTVLLLAAIGYIVADKYVLNDKQENGYINNVVNDSKTKNDWNLFVTNIKDNRNKIFGSIHEIINHVVGGGDEITYSIELSKSGILTVKYNGNNYQVATNVVWYKEEMRGNGGNYYLYYSTEDGSFYEASTQGSLYNKEDIKINRISSANNIVAVLPGDADSGPAPIFIDINGNIYRP